MTRARIVAAVLIVLTAPLLAGSKQAVIGSKHDLSVTGPGPAKSTSTSDACIFCHTPHSSYVDVKPLWNHTLSTQTYATYTSSTYNSGPQTPSAGVSRVCLSCHDGTVALGQTVSTGLIPVTGTASTRSILGTNLANDHPLGMAPADDGQLALSLFATPPSTRDPAIQLSAGRVECTSCHDPHQQNNDPVVTDFLARSNSGGLICLACHDPSRAQPNALNGWTAGSHATAMNTVPTTAAFGRYGSVAANACSNCHGSHNLQTASSARLLTGYEEAACSPCHSGTNASPALLNVLGEFTAKTYSHPTLRVSGQHDAAENVGPLNSGRHAECADCHNAHAASAAVVAPTPPTVSPVLAGVSGFDTGGVLKPAANEYQICYKCHADSANKPANSGFGRTANRLTVGGDPLNVRLKFLSVVRHNVSMPRQRTATQVPSLRSNILNLDSTAGRSLASGYIYCTDCHTNDQARASKGTGPNGPHGSAYTHLLERRYDQEAAGGGGASYVAGINGSAGLCNKCHDVAGSILADRSFVRHNTHVSGVGASCSTCHDPHGVTGGNTTNNYALVNFDTDVVRPSSSLVLRYEKTATGGRCYLSCHGVNHNPFSY